jgi:hypothetical protein
MTEDRQLSTQQYQEMDLRDEGQILSEMKGEFLSNYVYSFTQGTRTITNLSYAGIKEAIRRRGHFQIIEQSVTETDGKIRALVKIHDLVNDIDVLGASEADKDKPFAWVLAVNKAERNGYAKLIPAKFFAELIAEKLGKKQEPAKIVEVKPVDDALKGIPVKDRLMHAIRPDIANLIEFVHEDAELLVLKPTQRLQLEDFKETCHIIEDEFKGKWIKEDGIWEIPIPKQ